MEAIGAVGFGGFVSIRKLRANKLHDVPDEMGVYMVLRPSADAPTFLERSPAGHFKREDPSVSVDELQRNWVPGAPVVYIGKAGGPSEGVTLRSRLAQYLAFGAGQKVAHRGGRLIWQLTDADDLIVCWKTARNEIPREMEQRLIAQFKALRSGKRPFANLHD